VDEIMLEVSAIHCTLFNADRLTIYTVGEDKQTIVSKVKTGLNSFKDLKLPIAEHSIAGYVGLSKRMLNLRTSTTRASSSRTIRTCASCRKSTSAPVIAPSRCWSAPVAEPGSSELCRRGPAHQQQTGVPFGQLAEEG